MTKHERLAPSRLRAAFDRGARHYDLLVSLNPGYHRHLRAAAGALIERLRPKAGAGRVIDLGCGSGASTVAVLQAAGEAASDLTILGLDASAGMLQQARAKDWPAGVEFAEAEAGRLPVGDLGRGSWDGLLACYLFRNVPTESRDRAVAEAFELLAPGGWLVVQEYSVAGSRLARLTWDAVNALVIGPLGVLIDRNWQLYRYLWRSVHDFDAIPTFADRLAAAGFEQIAHRTVPGWQRGILHTVVARKLAAQAAPAAQETQPATQPTTHAHQTSGARVSPAPAPGPIAPEPEAGQA